MRVVQIGHSLVWLGLAVIWLLSRIAAPAWRFRTFIYTDSGFFCGGWPFRLGVVHICELAYLAWSVDVAFLLRFAAPAWFFEDFFSNLAGLH